MNQGTPPLNMAHSWSSFASSSFTQLVFQSTITGAHQAMAIVKNSVDVLPLLQTETSDHRDIFGHFLPVLQENGPLGGCGIVLRDGLKNGQVILITR